MATPKTHTHGPYSFELTPLHYDKAHLDPLRFQYDELGSLVAEKLQAISRQQPQQEPKLKARCPLDLYEVLEANHSTDPLLERFWIEVHTVPSWVDWAQLQRGQRFFYRYAAANIMGFAFQGFVGENSAAAGVVEVLIRTGGFSTRVLFRRLLETFQLILQVTKDLESIRPGGEGHTTAIRVRLLHAMVRNRIMKLARSREGYFDVGKFGVPVNTLDSIHSISTFCCNHMWLQLPQQGVYPQHEEMRDYIALWRYVGYLLATPDEYFASVPQAKATMESMLVHECQITDTSLIVGHNFVETLKDLPPFNVSAEFISAGSRALNGDLICDALGFRKAEWYHYACWKGHCWLVKSLAFVQQRSASLDAIVTTWWRETLHWAVIESRGGLSGGSKMDFKYVPDADRVTGKEYNGRKRLSTLPVKRPVEAFYLSIFSLSWLGLFGIVYSGLKALYLMVTYLSH